MRFSYFAWFMSEIKEKMIRRAGRPLLIIAVVRRRQGKLVPSLQSFSTRRYSRDQYSFASNALER
jgi:hypothetical protein